MISILAVIATSLIGSYYTRKGIPSKWFDCIRSDKTPPAYVFPIVWTILYILIAFAFGLALQDKDQVIIQLFVLNLIFNVLWCFVYFYKKKPGVALIVICIILSSIIQIMRNTKNKMITQLMIPYLIWITFATLLNYDSISKEKTCNSIG
jgi:tryptophan-rich sensory protein